MGWCMSIKYTQTELQTADNCFSSSLGGGRLRREVFVFLLFKSVKSSPQPHSSTLIGRRGRDITAPGTQNNQNSKYSFHTVEKMTFVKENSVSKIFFSQTQNQTHFCSFDKADAWLSHLFSSNSVSATTARTFWLTTLSGLCLCLLNPLSPQVTLWRKGRNTYKKNVLL